MKRIICWIKAVPFFIKSGIWCPHIYVEEKREKVIIISTNSSFRVSTNYNHKSDEKVHPNATLMRSRCECCGRELLSWFDGDYEDIIVLEN